MMNSPNNLGLSKTKPSFWPMWVALGMLIGLLVLITIATKFRDSAIGKPLPKLDLKPLYLAETEITPEYLQGKVVVLHIWGTWCPDCRREFPEFTKIYQALQNREDIVILSVSCSPEAEKDLELLKSDTEKFLTDAQALIPTYCDPAAYTRGQLAYVVPSGSSRYPTTIITDRRGDIYRIWEEKLPAASEVLAIIEQAHTN